MEGITVYVDHTEGRGIHREVTYELAHIKTEELLKINHPVYTVFIGLQHKDKARRKCYYRWVKVLYMMKKNLKILG